jgi:hypothetical protein
MIQESKQGDGKKSYEPPRLATISLRPEEAVLGHCKSPSGGGNSTFGSCQPVGICNSVGS